MTDKIKLRNDYLSPDLARRCKENLDELKGKFVWAVNKFVWGAGLFDDNPGCYYITTVGIGLKQDIISDIKHNHDIDIPDNAYVMFYMGMNQSEVYWHKDYAYDWAISIYLNSEWEESWGGIFEYSEDDSIKQDSKIHQILPFYNRGVEQRGQINHRVSRTSSDAIVRESIQIFVPLDPSQVTTNDRAMYDYIVQRDKF